jgi:hypothetical protein
MTNYEVVNTGQGEVIKRTDADGKEFWIPKDESNSDYQRYLRWLNGEEENGTIS